MYTMVLRPVMLYGLETIAREDVDVFGCNAE